MKKLASLLIATILLHSYTKAQLNLELFSSTENYTPINGNTPILNGNGVNSLSDEGFANFVPIGFNFSYNNGTPVNELSISTNGFISFMELSSAYVVNNLTSGATGERPLVAALWDDLNLDLTTNLKYTTNGVAPNRVFIVEWANARWGYGATTAAISFQIKLFETSNIIKFAYQQESGTPVSPSASIGITNASTGSGSFMSLINTSSNPSTSTSSEIKTIVDKPSTNQVYTFRAASTTPVVFGNISVAKNVNGNLLQWNTLSELNNKGFEIERSIDGRSFSTILFENSKATNGNSNTVLNYSIVDVKPFVGTNYYRIKQLDKDGKVHFSSVVFIKNIDANNNWATISLYPNPVKEKLNVQVSTKKNEDVTVTVFNNYGQQISQTNKAVQEGNTLVSVNVSNLAMGYYTVKVTNNSTNATVVKSFVK